MVVCEKNHNGFFVGLFEIYRSHSDSFIAIIEHLCVFRGAKTVNYLF